MRIVFVSPRAWDVATNRPGIHGGAELQVTRLARALAARGHAVTILTEGDPAHEAEVVMGVRVRQGWSPKQGLPFFGIFVAAKRLGDVIRSERPDVVILRAASPFVGLLADQAGRDGHRFVFMTSNDSNVDGRWEASANWRDRFLYRRGVTRAHLVITQTGEQTSRLSERFHVRGFRLHSAVPVLPQPAPIIQPDHVFWAGRFEPHKRPHLLLDLAHRAPDLTFRVAGWMPGNSDYARQFEEAGRQVSNIELVGHLSPVEMESGYLHAIALLSTAAHEGVSNTFLEAWRLGLPVVSMGSDPDGAIQQFDLGAYTADPDEVVAALRQIRDDPDRRAILAATTRRYMERHEEPLVVAQLESRLMEIIS